jgi:hypothetical protein
MITVSNLSHFLKHICDGLQISYKISSAFYPETMAKQSTQIKHLSGIFDVSLVINKIIGVIYYFLYIFYTIAPYTLRPSSGLSMPTLATILNGVSWTFQ